jgi:hypothetical protein
MRSVKLTSVQKGNAMNPEQINNLPPCPVSIDFRDVTGHASYRNVILVKLDDRWFKLELDPWGLTSDVVEPPDMLIGYHKELTEFMVNVYTRTRTVKFRFCGYTGSVAEYQLIRDRFDALVTLLNRYDKWCNPRFRLLG